MPNDRLYVRDRLARVGLCTHLYVGLAQYATRADSETELRLKEALKDVENPYHVNGTMFAGIQFMFEFHDGRIQWRGGNLTTVEVKHSPAYSPEYESGYNLGGYLGYEDLSESDLDGLTNIHTEVGRILEQNLLIARDPYIQLVKFMYHVHPNWYHMSEADMKEYMETRFGREAIPSFDFVPVEA